MGVRLDPDAKHALHAASELARRYRHRAVEPEHLLRALLDIRESTLAFTERAVNSLALADCVDARLAEWPASGLYRDTHAQPAVAGGLSALLARAGAGRLSFIVRPLTVLQVARAACEERTLAALLFDARSEVATPAEAFAQARTLARARGHVSTSVYHLVRTVADQAWLVAPLVEANVDVAGLIRCVEGRLEASSDSDPDIVADFEALAPLGREHLIGILFRIPAVERLLGENDVAVVDVLRALVGAKGERVDDDALPPDTDEMLDIVFHDDDITTMEFVVEMLTTYFAVPSNEALALTLGIHKSSSKVVKRCAANEARWRIEKARAHASAAKMPLRITWRLVADG